MSIFDRDISIFDALAIAQAVKKGEARLLGKVVFHRQTMSVTVRWEPTGGGNLRRAAPSPPGMPQSSLGSPFKGDGRK